ncbi:exo-beta-N-acetylmuramidase NamZ domain-containing protein, partial [Fibrobacterota bacterium]
MKDRNLSVKLPIDNLAGLWPGELKKAAIGALLHPASVTSTLAHSLDVLWSLNGDRFELKCLFGPQHGFLGETQDNMIEWNGFNHAELRVPVYSLYGKDREPTEEMLSGLDAMVVDLQDVGARYYTFIWTMYLCMRACEQKGIPVIVLDRPNPINAITTEGPLLSPDYRSFVGLHPIPARHGMTMGQLAEKFKLEAFPNCEIRVLHMENWKPDLWFDETGLPWVSPSPNMPTLDTATVYP